MPGAAKFLWHTELRPIRWRYRHRARGSLPSLNISPGQTRGYINLCPPKTWSTSATHPCRSKVFSCNIASTETVYSLLLDSHSAWNIFVEYILGTLCSLHTRFLLCTSPVPAVNSPRSVDSILQIDIGKLNARWLSFQQAMMSRMPTCSTLASYGPFNKTVQNLFPSP